MLSNIGRRTGYISGMRKDGSPPVTTNAKRLLRAINPHPSVKLQTALQTLDSTNWTTGQPRHERGLFTEKENPLAGFFGSSVTGALSVLI
jgi:hypothetical protein